MEEDRDPTASLIEQLQSGATQEEIFREVFRLEYTRVHRFFRRKGFSPEESKDLAQETFFQVFKSLPFFRRESRFEAWIFAIVDHVYLNEVRRRKTEKRHAVEESLELENSSERAIPAPDLDPLGQVIQKEQLGALRSALAGLPEQMRMCCTLRYERGLKYQEIAAIMNISIETVKAHLHQARKRLTAELGGTEEPVTKL
jgi:RNA polymerase sigma-70 factor (ECF subfamily)